VAHRVDLKLVCSVLHYSRHMLSLQTVCDNLIRLLSSDVTVNQNFKTELSEHLLQHVSVVQCSVAPLQMTLW